jgi:hypothetical protein
MTESTSDQHTALSLSRSEAWVVHAALLARIERESEADNDVEREVALLRTVESGEGDVTVDAADLDVLREALAAYLADAPGRDRIPGQTVLDDISVALT